MRFICFDLGDKRTGVAVGDSVTGLVSPVEVVETPIGVRGGEALLDALVRSLDVQIGERSAAEVVLGLPMNMDGTEGPRAKLVRAFGERLARRTGRTVHYQDERLTSAAADWTMARSGLTHKQKKDRRDALAAAAILKDFLGQRAGPPREPGGAPGTPDY